MRNLIGFEILHLRQYLPTTHLMLPPKQNGGRRCSDQEIDFTKENAVCRSVDFPYGFFTNRDNFHEQCRSKITKMRVNITLQNPDLWHLP